MTRPRATRRSFLERTSATLVAIGFGGCLDGGSSTDREVTMTEEFAFDPATASVDAGQSLTWRNTDTVGHTVTAYEDELPDGAAYFASGGFESERAARNRLSRGLIASGDTYEHTFETAGTYEYFCIPHEGTGMVGTVEVR